ncbi:hypothetical protein BH23VER1_BH23VER1_31830 [soil metagenome]
MQVTLNIQQNVDAGGDNTARPGDGLGYVLDFYAPEAKSEDGLWFGTFCLEKNEHFDAGAIYRVALDGSNAIGGGFGGAVAGVGDPISLGTAWLYGHFAIGNLSGYGYSMADAAALQDLIWWLEDEHVRSEAQLVANPYYGLVFDFYGSNLKADYEGSAVQVMNVTTRGGIKKQDQLVLAGRYTPPTATGTPVPDSGGTVLFLGLALLGLRALHGKRGT